VLLFSRASRSLAAKRDSSSQDAVCLYVCTCVCGIFFPNNPYLQAGLTGLDEIWHDERSYGVASPKNFGELWPTLFWEHKFLIADISGIFN